MGEKGVVVDQTMRDKNGVELQVGDWVRATAIEKDKVYTFIAKVVSRYEYESKLHKKIKLDAGAFDPIPDDRTWVANETDITFLSRPQEPVDD